MFVKISILCGIYITYKFAAVSKETDPSSFAIKALYFRLQFVESGNVYFSSFIKKKYCDYFLIQSGSIHHTEYIFGMHSPWQCRKRKLNNNVFVIIWRATTCTLHFRIHFYVVCINRLICKGHFCILSLCMPVCHNSICWPLEAGESHTPLNALVGKRPTWSHIWGVNKKLTVHI